MQSANSIHSSTSTRLVRPRVAERCTSASATYKPHTNTASTQVSGASTYVHNLITTQQMQLLMARDLVNDCDNESVCQTITIRLRSQ